jgi:hypothetical protein
MPKSKNPINHKIYRVLKPFVIKLVGDEGFELKPQHADI